MERGRGSGSAQEITMKTGTKTINKQTFTSYRDIVVPSRPVKILLHVFPCRSPVLSNDI